MNGETSTVTLNLGNVGGPSREECALLTEASAELAEIRALNGKPRILSEGEVRNWLAERNRNFALLIERGLAGGKLRFRISHPEQQEAEAASSAG